MANVNRRKSYTIKEKLAIIERVKSGVSKAHINRELGIPEGTIRGWIAEEGRLRWFLDKLDEAPGLQRKKTRLSRNEIVDDCLYAWFVHKRSLGSPVSGPALKMQAETFFCDLKLEGKFRASDGWLWRWKKRHGIGEITLAGESESHPRPKVPRSIPVEFQCVIERDVYTVTSIISRVAMKSALFSWMLPTDTSLGPEISPETKQAWKLSNDRKSRFCFNKAGTHKLLCVSGKSKSPRFFKFKEKLSVQHTSSSNDRMTTNVLLTWLQDSFVPLVCQHLKKRVAPGIKGIAAFIDDCPAHLPA
uniref:HTH CENPB-type domain-containing protein n=1 Tax=Petromyzon marinus TaxID=7757 RepID=S4R5E2_PETMA